MRLATALVAALVVPQEAANRWFYFDSSETDSGPRLLLDDVEVKAESDAILISYIPDRPYGNHPRLSVDRGDRNRVLIRFDLEGADAFERATLRLDMHQSTLGTVEPVKVALHRVTETWSERDACWRVQPAYDEEPLTVVRVGPEEGTVDIEVGVLAHAWASGEQPNHGVLLRAVEPLELPTVPTKPASGAKKEDLATLTDRELIGMYEWADSLDEALRRAKREKKRVFAVVSAAFRPEPITEHERALLVTCLSHPDVRATVARDFVPVRVRVSPNDVALDADGRKVRAKPFGRSGLTLASAKPPALAVLKPGSKRRRVTANMGVFDHVEVLSLLGAEPESRGATEGDGPEARYWRAAALARTDRAASGAALVDLESKHPDSPWALKARARRAFPDLAIGYESLSAPERGDDVESLIAGAVELLVTTQLPDGSWPMGHPTNEPHREGISVLCAHALLIHGRNEAADKAYAWLARRIEAQSDEALNSFTAAYWLDLELDRFELGVGSEDAVAAAIAKLAGGQLDSGAWSYSREFGERWRGGFSGWPTTDRGRAHGMNSGIAMDSLTRARERGHRVPSDVLDRGRAALEEMRVEAGRYTYTWPEPRNFEGAVSSIGRAPAAETALWRMDAIEKSDLAIAVQTFFDRRDVLLPPAKLSDSWLPPHMISGYFHSFAVLHGARAIAALGGKRRDARLAALAEDVVARVESDGSWVDTLGLGKPYATAMALLILDLAGK